MQKWASPCRRKWDLLTQSAWRFVAQVHPEFQGLMSFMQEIGSTKVTVFKRDSEATRISTIVMRGATNNFLNDIERSLEDAVNCYKQLCKDGRFVAGGGAVEVEIARRIQQEADSMPGLDQV